MNRTYNVLIEQIDPNILGYIMIGGEDIVRNLITRF